MKFDYIIKNFLLIFLINFFINTATLSIENKIILKINNEIITSIDIFNEAKYLKALNPNLKNLDNVKLMQVAKTSMIREKIKELEILKYNVNEISEVYLENLIKNIYTNIGLKNKEEFENYINSLDIDMSIIKKKIKYEALWNQLIYEKFYKKLKIDREKLIKEIQRNNQKLKSYLLYEIVYNVDQNAESKKVFEKIKKSIGNEGFENTASLFSISESSKLGGNLGWINENSINNKINKEILKLQIGEYTNPILIPGGFLILYIKDKKEIEIEIDIKKELEKKVRSLQNEQLNQYSTIYFKKIKKDILIDEK